MLAIVGGIVIAYFVIHFICGTFMVGAAAVSFVNDELENARTLPARIASAEAAKAAQKARYDALMAERKEAEHQDFLKRTEDARVRWQCATSWEREGLIGMDAKLYGQFRS